MAKLTPQTVKAMAQELYGYELTDEAAVAVANAAGAMVTHSRRLGNIDLSGVQPPFGYPADGRGRVDSQTELSCGAALVRFEPRSNLHRF
jgi:hypothetical protein